MADQVSAVGRVVNAIAEVDAKAWDRLANPRPHDYDPFVSHAFLAALEASGSVGPGTGWLASHIVLEDSGGDGRLRAALPCYLKSHSQGEYVFDHGWADAYERAGGRYYPKLQAAVPFTPVPGRRFLVGAGEDAEQREAMLLRAALEVTERQGASSFHATFLSEGEWQRLGALGLLQRSHQQFHWFNEGYGSFDDFLARLASRKRKTIRKERKRARENGIDIIQLTGGEITEAHWDAFFAFYMDTGARKWGRPYLNRAFFSLLGEALAERILLVMARRNGRFIAGALNLIGGKALYGRYWGALEHHDCLHFEVCYYQAIEYAIAHGLARVEAGAQGEHKLARGYRPTTTYSVHYIRDAALRRAVAEFLERERRHVTFEQEVLGDYLPFRKDFRGSNREA